MSKLIEKLNQKGSEKLSEQEQKKLKEGCLVIYEQALKEDALVKVCFDAGDDVGNLSAADENGVQIVLKSEDFKLSADYYNERIKHKFLAVPMSVKISSIDKDKNIVYVVSAFGGSGDVNTNAKSEANVVGQICTEMRKELKKGNTPRVWGRVISVNDNNALVRIFDKDIIGIIYLQNWQSCYTRFLKQVCYKDAIYAFDVTQEMVNNKENTESKKKKRYKEPLWALNRKNITPDPWSSVQSDFITQGSVIQIKAIDVPRDKSYFWGVSKRAPGIEIMVNTNDKLMIKSGLMYNCKVREIDLEKHIFRAAPFAYSEESGKTVDIVYKKGFSKASAQK